MVLTFLIRVTFPLPAPLTYYKAQSSDSPNRRPPSSHTPSASGALSEPYALRPASHACAAAANSDNSTK